MVYSSIEKAKRSVKGNSLYPLLRDRQLGEERARIFELIDRYSGEGDRSFDRLLEGAMAALSHAEKSFIEKRSDQFLIWLFEKLSNRQEKNRVFNARCFLSTFSHRICFPFQSKDVLSLFFEVRDGSITKEQVKMVVEAVLPNITYINDSVIVIENQRDRVTKAHLEIHKGKAFTESERLSLEEKLLQQTHKFLSVPQDSLVVPSNRELLMKSFRWIMQDFNREDLPHVFIDFSKKTMNGFEFSVLICFIDHLQNQMIMNQLNHPDIHIDGLSSYFENGLKKEGAVLTVDIPLNHSLSVIDARKNCFLLLESLIGTFRDVNGGLLEKIEDNFNRFSSAVSAPVRDLKSFFYGISPQERQAITPIPFLAKIFKALNTQKTVEKEISYGVTEEDNFICVIITIAHPEFEKEYRRFLLRHFKEILIIPTYLDGSTTVCCALEEMRNDEAERLKALTFSFYSKWKEKKEIKQVLRLGCTSQFRSLDPRIGVQEEPSHLLKMLFEGLMRIGPDGAPQMAIAERIEISDSGRCYRFYLRESYWSNGTPLTAHDFAYSWEASLQPDFWSPLSYLFYSIKNAQSVKEGKLPSKDLGIHVIDDHLLEVQLQYPTPYFLEVCAHSSFSPICTAEDVENPSWPEAKERGYVCNGPFVLDSTSSKEMILSKNLHYWNVKKVHLEKVSISSVGEEEAVNLFRNKELDLLLYPFSKNQGWKSIQERPLWGDKGIINARYLGFNCSKGPFSNRKLRQAFSLALDRSKLAAAFSNEAYPHYSPYAPNLTTLSYFKTEEENMFQARKLFSEAILELGIDLQEIREENIYVASSAKKPAEVMCLQLNAAFGLSLSPQVLDISELFLLLRRRVISLYVYGWTNRIQDISYFIDAFSSSRHTINYSCWSNESIRLLIDNIRRSNSSEERKILEHEAEKILHHEKPIVPIFYTPLCSAIPLDIKNISLADSQHIDISFAYKA